MYVCEVSCPTLIQQPAFTSNIALLLDQTMNRLLALDIGRPTVQSLYICCVKYPTNEQVCISLDLYMFLRTVTYSSV